MKYVIVGLTVLVGMTVAAHSQSRGSATSDEPAHPGTAILDSMGIFAGAHVPVSGLVHPGTAILDSMGIFAGMPIPNPKTDGNAVAATIVTTE